jgi:hypothetical protein
MSRDPIGYVVVEYNQASGRPGFASGTFYHESEQREAADEARHHREAAKKSGRADTFAVARVFLAQELA